MSPVPTFAPSLLPAEPAGLLGALVGSSAGRGASAPPPFPAAMVNDGRLCQGRGGREAGLKGQRPRRGVVWGRTSPGRGFGVSGGSLRAPLTPAPISPWQGTGRWSPITGRHVVKRTVRASDGAVG